MTIYDTRIVKTRTFADVQERTIQLIRKDRKPIMKVEDVRDLVDGLQKAADKKHETIRILVRAMTADGMKTLKGYTTQLQVEEFENYYKNSVQDPSKFSYFSQLEISVEKVI